MTAVVNLITIGLFALAIVLYLSGQFIMSLAAGVLGLVITLIFLILWGDTAPGPLSRIPFLAVAIPVGLLLLFCLAMLLAGLLLPSSVPAGAGDTRVSTTIGAPGSTVNSQFRLDPSNLPPCPQATPRAGAVILAIDMSGSMNEGGAAQEAIRAAESFINEIDLSANRSGVVAFNSVATPVQPLTSDRDALLNAVRGLSASGGTSIAAALVESKLLLDASPNLNDTQRTIILLSDGIDDNPQLLQTANSIRGADIRIITIGLGSSIDNIQLQSIGDEYWPAPRPEDLASIYQGIARNINSTVATDVVVTVSYSDARFDLDPGSISPGPSSLTRQSITWKRNSISSAPQEFKFKVSPKEMGFLSLNDLGPQVELVDCLGNTQSFGGGTGPTVLSALPLIALWIPLLLLSLLNLILMILFGGRGARAVADPLARGQHVPADRVPPDYSWLDRLGTLSEETFPQQGNTARVTLIGLGAFGRWTLEQIKRELTGKYGQLPSNVRLLSIEIQPVEEDAAGSPAAATAAPRFVSRRERGRDGNNPDDTLSATPLDPEEIVLLQPNIKELEDKRDQELRESAWQNDSSYLRWWGGSRSRTRGKVGRALGRLAVIYDMRNGFSASLLINRLTAACRANPPGSRVILLASLGESPSSALIDVATLVRYVTAQANLDLRSVEAFLTIPSNVASSSDPAENAYAAALELQRFVQNRLYRFSYGAQSDAGFNNNRNPVDHFYFMDESSVAKSEDLQTTTWAAAADILTLIADSGLDGLQKERQLNPDRRMGAMWARGHLAVSAMSVFIQRLPIAHLRRAAEARLLYDALIGDEQSPSMYAMRRDPEGVQLLPPTWLATAQQRQEEVRQFLLGLSLQNKDRFFSEVLANALARGWADTITQLIALGRFRPTAVADKFSWALEEKAAQLLNGEAREGTPSHARGLGAWLAFLRELDASLDTLQKAATQDLSRISSDHRQDVLDVLTQAREVVVASRREVAGWRRSLLEESDPAGYGDNQGQKPTPLRNTLSTIRERAERQLQTLRSFKHQKLALDADMLNTLYAQIWPAKRAQVMERIGWRTELSGGRIALRLLVALPTPPTTQAGAGSEEEQERPKAQVVTYGLNDVQDGQIPIALLKVARAVSKELNDSGRLSLDISAVQKELLEHGDRRRWLKFDQIEAGDIEPLVENGYVTVPPGPDAGMEAETLANSISNIKELGLSTRPEGVHNTDAHQWAFVRETQLIALDTSESYEALERRYASGLNPDAYVFQAGKTAREHESIAVDSARPVPSLRQPIGPGRRSADTSDLARGPFTQQFVWTLDYRLRAISFARAYLYGLVVEQSSGGAPYLLRVSQDSPAGRARPGEISLNGNTLLEAMQYFCMDGPLSVSPGDTNNPLRETNMPNTLRAIEAEIGRIQSNRKGSQEVLDARQKALQKELNDLKAREEKTYSDRVRADLIRFILAAAQKGNSSSSSAGYDHLRQR